MQLSTSANFLHDKTYKTAYTDQVERIAAHGFKVFDFGFIDMCGQGSPLLGDNWEEWAANIKKRTDNAGIRFGQSHSPIFNFLVDNETKKLYDELTIRSMKVAEIIGIPWMVWYTKRTQI